jgi:hypothetical protein
MSVYDNEPAAGRTPLDARTPGHDDPPPEGGQAPDGSGQAQSGKAILLNWCIMIVGLGIVAFAAHWLLG